MKNGGVVINGDFYAGGDVVGRDKIMAGGGEVACDFIWKGSSFKGLCYPEDQQTIQAQIDKYLSGNMTVDNLIKRVKSLSPNVAEILSRMI